MSGAQRSSCCKKNIRRGKCVWCGNHTTGYIPLGSAKSTASPSPGGGGLFGVAGGGAVALVFGLVGDAGGPRMRVAS